MEDPFNYLVVSIDLVVVVEDFHQWVENFHQEEVVEACYLQVVVEVAILQVDAVERILQVVVVFVGVVVVIDHHQFLDLSFSPYLLRIL